jgi:ATP-dependent RNA helicase RhlE
MQITNFSSLKLIEPIQKALIDVGYTIPTPIQIKAIPPLLNGEDLLGCAQTGTGKTAAFALPILNHLSIVNKKNKLKNCRCLVLVPTRELAIQVHESFTMYGKYLKLKSIVIFGGVGQKPQVTNVYHGVDVLVATPGRLQDLINQGHVILSEVEVLVLDEADRMLDMGFIHDIKRIISLLPKQRQNLFFSATMPPEIEKLSRSILNNPTKVEVTPIASTAEKIVQSIMFVDKENKRALLKHILNEDSFKKVIVFSRTKHGANKVVLFLNSHNIKAEAIHGNKSQSARQNALLNFKNGSIRVLVATDIAARGIDIDEISHVINLDLPSDSESYVHRIGRTARAGSSGIAISFCDAEEKAYLKDIEKLIGKKIELDTNHPFHSVNVAEAKILSKAEATKILEGRRNNGPRPRLKFTSRSNPKSNRK